jgi:hypothetical protein
VGKSGDDGEIVIERWSSQQRERMKRSEGSEGDVLAEGEFRPRSSETGLRSIDDMERLEEGEIENGNGGESGKKKEGQSRDVEGIHLEELLK